MKTIYRMECSTCSKGVYNCLCEGFHDGNALSRMAWSHGDDNHPPASFRAFSAPGAGKCKCACPSMKALFAWFGGWVRPMLKDGAVIRKIQIPDSAVIWTDGVQLVFDASQASN